MKSDPSVICYAEDDPAYAGSVYAEAVGLMGTAKLVPLGMVLLVLAPSDLLGILSNKYRGFNPSREGLIKKFASWEVLVHLRKVIFVLGSSEVLKVGGSAASNSVSALVYVLALALQLIFAPYEESRSNMAESFSLTAVLGVLALAPWLAKEGGGLEDFLETTVMVLLGLALVSIVLAQVIVFKSTRKGAQYKPVSAPVFLNRSRLRPRPRSRPRPRPRSRLVPCRAVPFDASWSPSSELCSRHHAHNPHQLSIRTTLTLSCRVVYAALHCTVGLCARSD